MTLQDNGELQTNEEFDHDSTSSLEDDNEDLPCGEDLQVVIKVLNMQLKEKDEAQRENIFHIVHTLKIGK